MIPHSTSALKLNSLSLTPSNQGACSPHVGCVMAHTWKPLAVGGGGESRVGKLLGPCCVLTDVVWRSSAPIPPSLVPPPPSRDLSHCEPCVNPFFCGDPLIIRSQTPRICWSFILPPCEHQLLPFTADLPCSLSETVPLKSNFLT